MIEGIAIEAYMKFLRSCFCSDKLSHVRGPLLGVSEAKELEVPQRFSGEAQCQKSPSYFDKSIII